MAKLPFHGVQRKRGTLLVPSPYMSGGSFAELPLARGRTQWKVPQIQGALARLPENRTPEFPTDGQLLQGLRVLGIPKEVNFVDASP